MSRRRPTPSRSVEESIVHALFDLANHLGRRGETLAAASGLTTQQWIVLLHVAGDPNFPNPAARPDAGVLPSDIAAARGVSRAAISVVVNQLVERGLIAQRPDAADKRRRRLTLTPAGEQVLSQLEPLRRDANRRLFAPLSTADREQLLRLLRVCLERLDELARQAPAPVEK